jgi:hypothetical protein
MSSEAANTMEENFGGVFQRYKSRMSTVLEERYNAINLRALNFPDPPMNSAIMIAPRNLPAGTRAMTAESCLKAIYLASRI